MNMESLKSLLDIQRVLSNSDIEKELESLAKTLMNEYCISNGKHTYRLLEIEFYIYWKDISKNDKRHADEHVYPRTADAGRIFFHKSGMDICFSSNMEEGYFGGVLIRALEREDKKCFGGPRICSYEVLNSANSMCVIQKCTCNENSFDVDASERIGIKDWSDAKYGWKDEYYNKEYRFVRSGWTDISMTLPKFDFESAELKFPIRKYKFYN